MNGRVVGLQAGCVVGCVVGGLLVDGGAPRRDVDAVACCVLRVGWQAELL